MLKNSGRVGATVFVTAILLSGAGVDFLIDSAHADNAAPAAKSAQADNCLAAPKGASPAGQHWYYHVDRATHRKCWYLHTTEQIQHRAVASHQAAAAADANAEPMSTPRITAAPAAAPSPPPGPPAAAAVPPVPPAAAPAEPAPTPDSTAGNGSPAPHVTVLSVRTSTPFVGTAVIPQQNTPEQVAAAPVPQMLPHDAVAPATDGAKPSADAAGAGPQSKGDAAFNGPAQTASAAAMNAKTKTAEMFILVAFVFGLAAALIAVVSRIAGLYRKPRISVEPDDAWVDGKAGHDEQDVPFLDPQEHYGLADLHAEEWLDRSTSARDACSAPPVRTGDSPGPSEKDIQLALRVLREARQSRVA